MAALKAWTLDNLRQYWQPWLERYKQVGEGVEVLDDPLVWGVLGVARLHYTLATGQIVSKSGAGQYALQAFDGRWNRIVSEALRIRSNSAAPSKYDTFRERHREAVAYMRVVIADALNSLATG